MYNTYTKEELQRLVKDMGGVAESTYWLFFHAGMGSRCHAFLEFNGLISQYVKIAQRAAAAGIDFTQANVHNQTPLPVEIHDLEYLAEKIRCIFGPLIDANPEARELFKKKLFPETANE